jgi:hypothetical protein
MNTARRGVGIAAAARADAGSLAPFRVVSRGFSAVLRAVDRARVVVFVGRDGDAKVEAL